MHILLSSQKITTPLKDRLALGLRKYPKDAPKICIKTFEKMGFGIVAEEEIETGTFIMPYHGDVMSPEEFALRNKVYEKCREGSYYIEVNTPYRGKEWVVDGTRSHWQVNQFFPLTYLLAYLDQVVCKHNYTKCTLYLPPQAALSGA